MKTGTLRQRAQLNMFAKGDPICLALLTTADLWVTPQIAEVEQSTTSYGVIN
jgi:hypothetical protein